MYFWRLQWSQRRCFFRINKQPSQKHWNPAKNEREFQYQNNLKSSKRRPTVIKVSCFYLMTSTIYPLGLFIHEVGRIRIVKSSVNRISESIQLPLPVSLRSCYQTMKFQKRLHGFLFIVYCDLLAGTKMEQDSETNFRSLQINDPKIFCRDDLWHACTCCNIFSFNIFNKTYIRIPRYRKVKSFVKLFSDALWTKWWTQAIIVSSFTEFLEMVHVKWRLNVDWIILKEYIFIRCSRLWENIYLELHFYASIFSFPVVITINSRFV